MLKTILSAMGLSVWAAGALAAETISEINVTVELHSMENSEAAHFWNALGSDLEAAIAERITGHLGEDGSEIDVEINEVALTPDAARNDMPDRSVLKGLVKFIAPEHVVEEVYELSVTTEETMGDSHAVYDAMIAAFAENVAGKID